MSHLYYPGCTLYEKAGHFDASGRAAAAALGLDLVEMPSWTCCGATFPLTTRKVVGMVAPIRILTQIRRAGAEEVVTLCAFCYNVLRRANATMRDDPEFRLRINLYLRDEYEREEAEYEDYEGEVRVLHLLELLREKTTFDAVQGQVTRPLEGLRVAPYYGCMLLRPKGIGIDDPEAPTILEAFLAALGCDVLDFPYATECCGAYMTIHEPNVALHNSHEILSAARRRGADALALSCPLCAFNLDDRQREMREAFSEFEGLPVLYFTQLLVLALGLDEAVCGFDRHAVDPRPMLARRGMAE